MKVLDASALVEYLAGRGGATAVSARFAGTSSWLWAPQLVDAEVGHSLRGLVRAGELSNAAAIGAMGELDCLRLVRVDHRLLADRAWQLRNNLSFYDALYVALAEELDAPLITLDARLAGAPGIRAEIDVVQAS